MVSGAHPLQRIDDPPRQVPLPRSREQVLHRRILFAQKDLQGQAAVQIHPVPYPGHDRERLQESVHARVGKPRPRSGEQPFLPEVQFRVVHLLEGDLQAVQERPGRFGIGKDLPDPPGIGNSRRLRQEPGQMRRRGRRPAAARTAHDNSRRDGLVARGVPLEQVVEDLHRAERHLVGRGVHRGQGRTHRRGLLDVVVTCQQHVLRHPHAALAAQLAHPDRHRVVGAHDRLGNALAVEQRGHGVVGRTRSEVPVGHLVGLGTQAVRFHGAHEIPLAPDRIRIEPRTAQEIDPFQPVHGHQMLDHQLHSAAVGHHARAPRQRHSDTNGRFGRQSFHEPFHDLGSLEIPQSAHHRQIPVDPLRARQFVELRGTAPMFRVAVGAAHQRDQTHPQQTRRHRGSMPHPVLVPSVQPDDQQSEGWDPIHRWNPFSDFRHLSTSREFGRPADFTRNGRTASGPIARVRFATEARFAVSARVRVTVLGATPPATNGSRAVCAFHPTRVDWFAWNDRDDTAEREEPGGSCCWRWCR